MQRQKDRTCGSEPFSVYQTHRERRKQTAGLIPSIPEAQDLWGRVRKCASLTNPSAAGAPGPGTLLAHAFAEKPSV